MKPPGDEITRLRAALDESREDCRQLREVLAGGLVLYPGVRLTRGQRAVMAALMNEPGICGSERLFSAMASASRRVEPVDHDRSNLGPMICRLRQRLPHGVTIESVWGVGYTMSFASKALFLSIATARQVARASLCEATT